jgi:uncharacterized protein (DUF885 family)
LLRTNPVQATALGVRDHDDKISDLSPAARERYLAEAKALLARLERIAPAALTPADRTNHAILRRMLGETVGSNQIRPAIDALHHLLWLASGLCRDGQRPAVPNQARL